MTDPSTQLRGTLGNSKAIGKTEETEGGGGSLSQGGKPTNPNLSNNAEVTKEREEYETCRPTTTRQAIAVGCQLVSKV